jgi:glycosyltransferase involved in cell wall biosynthesis
VRVAFISRDWVTTGQFRGRITKTAGGSGYYRCVLPAAGLQEFGGIETGCFGAAAMNVSTDRIQPMSDDGIPAPGDWDVIVFQRWMLPEVVDKTRRAQQAGQIIVQDVDDHFWALHRSNRAHDQVDPEKSPDANSDHYTQELLAADLVTVSTPFLGDVIRGLGQPNVAVLQNTIDLRKWTRQPVRPKVKTIGWVGATSHRSGDLEQLGNALRFFMRDHKEIRFIHGGHSDANPKAAKLLKLPVSRIDTRPLMAIEQYPKLWKDIDVAICPLNPIPFNFAKSAIKAMEASAGGVPFIASDLDAYSAYGQGWLVKDELDWESALEGMLDFTVREAFAEAAYQRVQSEDISLRWKDWLAAYEIQASPVTVG